MKRAKKLIACLVAMSLAVLALSACKEEKAPETAANETEARQGEFVDYAGSVTLDKDSETAKQQVTVHLFIDGDTTHFNVPTSVEATGILKARYLGINTPESTGVIEKWGKQASNFTKEKLSNAESIYIESDDANWNFDNTTSHRCLCWVWYQPKGEIVYRNLNIELLQEGLAIANNSAQNRYGETCSAAINQAKAFKLHSYSDEADPLFYEGGVREVTLKVLRTNPTAFVNTDVSFEGTIIREYNNSLYVQEWDEEDGIYYGVSVYLGYSPDANLMRFCQIGNRVKFVGSWQYYEAGGTYQATGLKYNARKPEESCKLVEENVGTEFPEIAPKEFAAGKKTVTFYETSDDGESVETEQEFALAELIMSTSLTMKDLTVTKVYTTKSGKSEGAMTLTCTAKDGTKVDVRTQVLTDEEGNLVTESTYLNKTIDVKGVVDYYSGSYQIKIFTLSDITVH